jgi:DNA gyrase subunit B
LQKRLRELAFLNSGVRILFKDQRTGESEEFHYERGLIEFIESKRTLDDLHGQEKLKT